MPKQPLTREQKLVRIHRIVEAAVKRAQGAAERLHVIDPVRVSRASDFRVLGGTASSLSTLEQIVIVAEGYAEPGYGKGDDIVVFGNWNSLTRWAPEARESVLLSDLPARVGELLEKAGAEIEWEDEWTTCGECGRAVRTEPDSYSWTRSYTESEGQTLCSDCSQNVVSGLVMGWKMGIKYKLDGIRVLWRTGSGSMELYGIPYEMRIGQGPRDLVDAEWPGLLQPGDWRATPRKQRGEAPSDWVWLGTPGWYGNVTDIELEEIKAFLVRNSEYVPMNPGEWSVLPAVTKGEK